MHYIHCSVDFSLYYIGLVLQNRTDTVLCHGFITAYLSEHRYCSHPYGFFSFPEKPFSQGCELPMGCIWHAFSMPIAFHMPMAFIVTHKVHLHVFCEPQ